MDFSLQRKQGPLHIGVYTDIFSAVIVGNNMDAPQKQAEKDLPYDPDIPPLSIYTKEMKAAYITEVQVPGVYRSTIPQSKTCTGTKHPLK